MDTMTIITLLVYNTLAYAAPLIFTSIGGTFSERSGVVNVGLEGIMVMGAFSGIVFNVAFGDYLGGMTPWLALLVGGGVGLLYASLHAVATINFGADQVVSGTVLNLIAPSLAVFLLQVFYNVGRVSTIPTHLEKTSIPLLADIPIIGEIFFKNTSLPAFMGIGLAVLAWFVLNKTTFGLRLRSVGENPQAADTLGISVSAMRYAGVLISGFLGGIGGAMYAQMFDGGFSGVTIGGQGFIALAAMIFGRWNPIGACLSCMFFGFSQALAIVSAQIKSLQHIPSVYFSIAPYVLTILVLAFFFGKAVAPKASGENYSKGR